MRQYIALVAVLVVMLIYLMFFATDYHVVRLLWAFTIGLIIWAIVSRKHGDV